MTLLSGDIWRDTTSPSLPLVRASAVLPFIQFLEGAGAPVARYLTDAKLSRYGIEEPEELVPLLPILRFVDRAAAGEGVETLALLVGDKTKVTELGAFGRIIGNSATVASALATVIQKISLYNSVERIWLLEDGDQVRFCHTLILPDVPEARHGNLFAIIMMIKVIRLAMGEKWWPRQILMPEAEKHQRKYYEVLLQTDVAFHEGKDFVVVFDRPVLAHWIASTQERQTLRHGDATLLQRSAPAPEFGNSIRQLLGRLLRDGYPDIQLVADFAGLNARTFQRRLAKEGSTYSHLVQQVRLETAARLLRDDHAKVTDIAQELGYNDAAHFTRAFKQWMGVPPSDYRRLLRTGLIR